MPVADGAHKAVTPHSPLDVQNAQDRIPMGNLRGPFVFNFWRDAEHERGLWRRTSVASYQEANPEWEALLDVDALAAEENKNWVYDGFECAPSLTRCLISLSVGGSDAAETREFDLNTKSFLADGFALEEARSEYVYLDGDTILFATDFGEGTLTESGHQRIVKLWRRNEKLEDAVQLYEARYEDNGVLPFAMRSSEGPVPMVRRAISFFEVEYFFVRKTGDLIQLPLPRDALIQGMTSDRVLVTLRDEWEHEGETIPQGTLFAFVWDTFARSGAIGDVQILFTPGPRSSIDTVATGRDAVYVSILENVTGSVGVFPIRRWYLAKRDN